MKQCRDCKKTLPLVDFHVSQNNAQGRNTRCKECRSVKSSEDYKKNWFSKTVTLKKSWCKNKGVDFNLTEEYLKGIYTKDCPVFKKPFVRGNKGVDMAPTLDRIDPQGGYTKDNVRYISARANRIKYDATTEELQQVLDYIKGN